MRDLQIKFFWDPLPWEKAHRAGEQAATWSHVPRVGDLVNLILQGPAKGETQVTFCVARVLWNADGLDGSRIDISLASTGLTTGM